MKLNETNSKMALMDVCDPLRGLILKSSKRAAHNVWIFYHYEFCTYLVGWTIQRCRSAAITSKIKLDKYTATADEVFTKRQKNSESLPNGQYFVNPSIANWGNYWLYGKKLSKNFWNCNLNIQMTKNVYTGKIL